MLTPLGSVVRQYRDKEAQAQERREGQRGLRVALQWCQLRGIHLTSLKETNPFSPSYSMAFLMVHPRVSHSYTLFLFVCFKTGLLCVALVVGDLAETRLPLPP